MTQGFVNPYTYAVSAPTITTYTSGSGTYTVPAGVQFLVVEMVGGGGGGAGSSSDATGGTGGTGGTSTFGSSLLTCTGGAGGTGANPSVVGAGGTATLNSPATGISFNGQSGGGGEAQGAFAINQSSGPGGNTPFLGGGQSISSSATAITGQTAIANTGSGGGGGVYVNSSTGAFCGAGGGAGAYVKATISNPSATYSYAVGAGGTAGTAGTSGAAGGAGAAGIIIIYEYYQTLGIPTTLTLPLSVSNGGTGLSAGGPAFSAYASSSQSMTANTLTKITLDTELFDTNNNFASSRFTPTVAGYYQINGILRASGTTPTLVEVAIYKNGAQYNNSQINVNAPVYNTDVCIAEVIYFNGSTDYVELYGAVYCASGASTQSSNSAITSRMNGCYLRGA